MDRPVARALVLSALLGSCLPALGQDLAWSPRKEPLTFGAVPPPPPALASTAAVIVDRGAGDPVWPVGSVGDLVWRYALAVPADRSVPADGKATREVADSYPLADGGRIDVTGTLRIGSVGAGRVRLEFSLMLTGSALGALDLDLLFNAHTGRLESALFDLAAGLRWKGRITERPRTRAPKAPLAVGRGEGSENGGGNAGGNEAGAGNGNPGGNGNAGGNEAGGNAGGNRPQGPPAPAEPKPVAKQPKKPAVPVDPLHRDVLAAIERGRDWLLPLTHQRLAQYQRMNNNARPGYQAMGRLSLPCFALLRSGVEGQVLDPQFEWLAKQPLAETYSVSLYVMALEARSVTRQALPARPEPSRTVTRFQRRQVPRRDRALIQGAVAWLLAARNEGQGSWSYRGSSGTSEGRRRVLGGRADRSNSQFAVLALHSAMAAGVDVPAGIWKEIAQERVASQEAEGPKQSLAGTLLKPGAVSEVLGKQRKGARSKRRTRTRKAPGVELGSLAHTHARGWSYGMSRPTANGAAYGSMTAAGVSSLAVSLEGLRRLGAGGERERDACRKALRDGLAWLLHRFDPKANPAGARMGGRRGHYYYYAYSFEKAMDTAGVDRLGEVEWWREFARALVDLQQADGGWGSLEDTSFALLVLNRATLSARITSAGRTLTGPGAKSSWEWVRVKDELISAPQAIAALRLAGVDRESFQRAKLAWKALPLEHRPRVLPELVRLIERSDKPIQRWARARCKELVGTDDELAALDLHDAWEALRVASERGDHTQIGTVRELLADETTPEVLLRQALRTLGRLGGTEGLGELIELLDRPGKAWRDLVWAHVVGLAGKEPVPFEPKAPRSERAEQLIALRVWWQDAREELTLTARIRRAVRDLTRSDRAKQAEQALRALGKPAVPALIDALRDEHRKAIAHRVLTAITGQAFPPEPDPWLDWLRRGG